MGITLEQFDSMVSSKRPMGHRGQRKKLQQQLCSYVTDAASFITGQSFRN